MALIAPRFGNVDPNQQALLSMEDVQKRRAIAQQLIAENSGFEPLQHPLQAVAKVLGAGVGAYKERQADKIDAAGKGRRSAAQMSIIDNLLGNKPTGGTVASGSLPPIAAGPKPSSPAGGARAAAAGPAMASAAVPTGDRASYIRSGLVNRGLPEHVADAFLVNFKDESGLDPGINEAKPLVPGSRGGFGLYQLTGPRRREYESFASERGVNPSDIDAQLDFMMGELQGSEKRAGQRILSAPDTATAAQAIVNDFLRPAPGYRQERANRYASLGGSAPVQVASLDPSAGMAPAAPTPAPTTLAPTPRPLAAPQAPGGQQQAMAAALMGNAPLQAPMQATAVNAPMGMPSAPQMQQPAPQQQAMAQALTGGQMPQGPSGGVDRALIAQLLGDPYTEDLGQQLLMQTLEQNALEQQRAYDRMTLQEQRAYDAYLRGDERQYETGVRQEGYQREDARNAYTDGRQLSRDARDDFESDRSFGLQREQLVPTSVREFEYGQDNPAFFETQERLKRSGATNIQLPGQPNIGTIPPGFQAVQDPISGSWSMSPIPGGPAAAEAEAAETANANRENAQMQRSGLVAEEIDRALGLMNGGILPDTGVGAMLSGVPGTDAKAISTLLDTIKANIGFDELNKMRQQSVTGGALGNVTERELQFLQAVAGSLDQAQSQEQLTYNLNRLWNGYQDVIHGEGKGPKRRELAPVGDPANPVQLDEIVVPSGWEEDWEYLTPEEKQRVLSNG